MSKPSLGPAQVTRRRDCDPVKISKDFRVSWYPSGSVGVGIRKQSRLGTAERAEAFADEVRAQIERHQQRGPLSHVTLGNVWIKFIGFLRKANSPVGTINQYRSNWRCHVPEAIADVSCGDLHVGHWTAIFEEMLHEGSSSSTIHHVARTLGALLTYAEERNYFRGREPFGVSKTTRRGIVKRMAERAQSASPKKVVELGECPSPTDIHEFANIADEVLPGYGRLLVLLAFATGLRFTE